MRRRWKRRILIITVALVALLFALSFMMYFIKQPLPFLANYTPMITVGPATEIGPSQPIPPCDHQSKDCPDFNTTPEPSTLALMSVILIAVLTKKRK